MNRAKARGIKITRSNSETSKIKYGDIEGVKTKEFLSINESSLLFGISRRTLYRIIARGELDIAKFGARTVIRRCDLDAFFSIATEQSNLHAAQVFPGVDNCYTITQIQKKFAISSGALYWLIQRNGLWKYSVGKFNYVAKKDIDIIFNARENEKD
ncbi:excisionase family DNA binding protein [Flavobacterium sp. 2755]|uniref:helix-turn-helix domain-containing protein n=1 Tax=Flavobacterium sp. 2755 TaxID=2817765 RepID=UPI0028544D77|nr:helix-turn-helix domain-containing protein [Flavobacterium sp. 2755]MDR6764732.1 excisionase family DNA binding protein [Flavobacterium sp. 2755]